MTTMQAFILGLLPAPAAFAFGAYWKSRFHRAKAEVYREFAQTYRGMVDGGVFSSQKKERVAASQRHHMQLLLCDPLVRDGLAYALIATEGYWHRIGADEQADWKIEMVQPA